MRRLLRLSAATRAASRWYPSVAASAAAQDEQAGLRSDFATALRSAQHSRLRQPGPDPTAPNRDALASTNHGMTVGEGDVLGQALLAHGLGAAPQKGTDGQQGALAQVPSFGDPTKELMKEINKIKERLSILPIKSSGALFGPGEGVTKIAERLRKEEDARQRQLEERSTAERRPVAPPSPEGPAALAPGELERLQQELAAARGQAAPAGRTDAPRESGDGARKPRPAGPAAAAAPASTPAAARAPAAAKPHSPAPAAAVAPRAKVATATIRAAAPSDPAPAAASGAEGGPQAGSAPSERPQQEGGRDPAAAPSDEAPVRAAAAATAPARREDPDAASPDAAPAPAAADAAPRGATPRAERERKPAPASGAAAPGGSAPEPASRAAPREKPPPAPAGTATFRSSSSSSGEPAAETLDDVLGDLAPAPTPARPESVLAAEKVEAALRAAAAVAKEPSRKEVREKAPGAREPKQQSELDRVLGIGFSGGSKKRGRGGRSPEGAHSAEAAQPASGAPAAAPRADTGKPAPAPSPPPAPAAAPAAPDAAARPPAAPPLGHAAKPAAGSRMTPAVATAFDAEAEAMAAVRRLRELREELQRTGARQRVQEAAVAALSTAP